MTTQPPTTTQKLPPKTVIMGQATETDSGQAAGRSKAVVLGQASESGTGRTADISKLRDVSQALETDTELPVSIGDDGPITVVMGQACETNSARQVTHSKGLLRYYKSLSEFIIELIGTPENYRREWKKMQGLQDALCDGAMPIFVRGDDDNEATGHREVPVESWRDGLLSSILGQMGCATVVEYGGAMSPKPDLYFLSRSDASMLAARLKGEKASAPCQTESLAKKEPAPKKANSVHVNDWINKHAPELRAKLLSIRDAHEKFQLDTGLSIRRDRDLENPKRLNFTDLYQERFPQAKKSGPRPKN